MFDVSAAGMSSLTFRWIVPPQMMHGMNMVRAANGSTQTQRIQTTINNH